MRGHKVFEGDIDLGSFALRSVRDHVLARDLSTNPAVTVLTPDLEELPQQLCAVLDLQGFLGQSLTAGITTQYHTSHAAWTLTLYCC